MYPTPTQLKVPLTPYTTGEFLAFGQKIRRHIILWATHLGDDIAAEPGTMVNAIGVGEVVLSEVRMGSEKRRNWGGVVILGHRAKTQNAKRKTQNFYSIYGHLTDLKVKVGEVVQLGQDLGCVAAGNTQENGWWRHPHLHFGIYTGPWTGDILPGYKRPEEFRTKLKYWHRPKEFIDTYHRTS